MLTVVVIGARGFIGSYLVDELQKSGHKVLPISRKDLSGYFQVKNSDQYPDGDVAIHLSEEPSRFIVNQQGSSYVESSAKTMRKLSNQFGNRLIYLSSGAVYGDQGTIPFTTQSDVFVTDSYSKLKLTNESIGIEKGATILRLANVYGYGMGKNNVLSDIIRQLPLPGVIEVRNEYPIRDFIFVEDVVKICSILVNNITGGILNIGSGVGVTIRELVEIILSINNQENRVIHSQEVKNKFSCNILNMSETNKTLELSPPKNLKENLFNMLKNMEKTQQ